VSDILIASVPIHGHVTPLLAVADGLVERGHRVRFLTGARFAAQVERTGSVFLPLPADADYDDRLLGNAAPAAGEPRPSGIAGLRYDVGQVFLAPARAQYDALVTHTQAPTDAVVVDPTFVGAMLLTGRTIGARPPVIMGGVLPLPLSSAYVPPFGLGLRPLRGLLGRSAVGRARNGLLRFLVERVVFGPIQRELDALHHEIHGRPGGAFIIDWMSTADAIVQLSVPAFEYPRPDAKVPIRFAGPLAPTSRSSVPSWWSDLDGNRPVVLVTQGTIANADLTELVRPTIDALADHDVLVVATTGGRPLDLLGALPDNVRAAEYLPYDRLFPLVDVFVTNGGYGGVHYALRHGVPLVVAGGNEDKPEVAARVAWSGVGLNLRTGRPSEKAIRRAVGRVLESGRYLSAADVAAAQIAEARGVDELVDVIDELRAAASVAPA